MLHNRLRRACPALVALILATTLFGFARLPRASPAERRALASQFAFTRVPLLPSTAAAPHTIRNVHPALRRIAAWISSVGASVALADLDADGLANDMCLVDPRFDTVTIAPVPGSGDRYRAFTLGPAPSADRTIAPTGCRFGDFNEDGLTDVLVYYWGRTPLVFLRRAPASPEAIPAIGPAEFRQLPIVDDARWNTNALTTADIDGDGHVDLIVANYFPDGATLLDPSSTSPFEMQNSMARAFNGGRKHLLLWDGATTGREPTVRFREARDVLPDDVSRGWTLAVGAADLDGDLRPEIYFANDFGPDRLLHNESRPGVVKLVPVEGRKTFTTPNSKVLGRDSFKSMGIDFGDLNGDGRLDLFVSNIANEYALEESHFAFVSDAGDAADAFRQHRAPFTDRSEELGLSRSGFSWEARLADFNNDGIPEALQAAGFVHGDTDRWPELQELAMGNNLIVENAGHWPHFERGDDISGHLHDPFFVRASNGRYVDLADDIGIGHPQVARGIAVADVDGDGRLDFAVARQWEPSDFYRNVANGMGASLELRLLVPVEHPAVASAAAVAGRPAIGAVARIVRPDGRPLIGEVDGGNGHSGARAPELHFGLGTVPAGTPIRVDIAWRDTHGVLRRATRTFAADPPPDASASRRGSRLHIVMLDDGPEGH